MLVAFVQRALTLFCQCVHLNRYVLYRALSSYGSYDKLPLAKQTILWHMQWIELSRPYRALLVRPITYDKSSGRRTGREVV